MGAPVQENISGVGTSAGPSWTKHDDNSVWLAWKGSGSDTSIWVSSAPSLHPDPSSGKYAFTPQARILDLATSQSPAIASLNGTLYLFYKGASDNFIYWATNRGGTHWVDEHKLALGGNGQDTSRNPQTGVGPTVTAANNRLYLFWKGADDDYIRWSVATGSSGEMSWTPEKKVEMADGAPVTDVPPAVALQGQTIHLATKSTPGDLIFWTTCASGDAGGTWSPQQLATSGCVHAPALTCDGNGMVWLAWTGSDTRVSFAPLSDGQWHPAPSPLAIGTSSRPALISTGKSQSDIMLCWKGAGDDAGIYYGSLIGPQVATPTGPAPGTTLGGNLNYLMTDLTANGGNALTGVSVTIEVTEDIVSDIGIGFQLNAYSNAGALSALQQYFIWQKVTADGVTIEGEVEPWPQSTAGTENETTKCDLFNHRYPLATLDGVKIPEGYRFAIALGTSCDKKVDSVTFGVWDDKGVKIYDQPAIKIVGSFLRDGKTKATSADIAEIVSFQLDLVGPIGSKTAKMTSGAGIITYYVDGTMSAQTKLPSNTDSKWHTDEQTNSVYSTLPAGNSGSFVQTFSTGS